MARHLQRSSQCVHVSDTHPCVVMSTYRFDSIFSIEPDNDREKGWTVSRGHQNPEVMGYSLLICKYIDSSRRL